MRIPQFLGRLLGRQPEQPAAFSIPPVEGAKAPNIEGMNFANTSFENATNVKKGITESGTPFSVVEKTAAPIAPEAQMSAAPGGEMKG